MKIPRIIFIIILDLVMYRNKKMQCKDIPTEPILHFLANHQGKWCTWWIGYSMPTVADVMPLHTPKKIQLAKMKMLIKDGLVVGCDCGCRGDFEITDKGLDYIQQSRTQPSIDYLATEITTEHPICEWTECVEKATFNLWFPNKIPSSSMIKKAVCDTHYQNFNFQLCVYGKATGTFKMSH